MKKLFTFSILMLSFSFLEAQVGIGTNTPHASAMLEVQSTNSGILLPSMTSSQRAAISTPASGLHVYDTDTKSLWFYNGAVWVNTASDATYGDVKSGFQSSDHEGWIKLDGRAISTLSAAQQTVANSLGFTGNLPDANTAYLVQNGGSMGSVSGANTVALTQANLPNVSFSGTAASSGAHSHGVNPPNTTTSSNGAHNHGSNATGGASGYGLIYANGWATLTGSNDYTWGEPNLYTTPGALNIYSAGTHTHDVDIPWFSSDSGGAHTHSVSVTSGGSGTAVNIAPKSLTVNMFVYLGK